MSRDRKDGCFCLFNRLAWIFHLQTDYSIEFTEAREKIVPYFCHTNRKKWPKTTNIGKSEGYGKRGLHLQNPLIIIDFQIDARVAELADALDLGSSAFGRGGSNPPSRTSGNCKGLPDTTYYDYIVGLVEMCCLEALATTV